MDNISPNIKEDILIKPSIIDKNLLRSSYSLEDMATYKCLFQKFSDIFSWYYLKWRGLILPLSNIVLIHGLMHP